MELQKTLTILSERIPYNNFKGILKKHDLPPGMGVQKTIEKILKIAEEKPEIEDKVNGLLDYYKNYLLVGEKAVKFYNVTPAAVEHLIERSSTLKFDEGLFREKYPHFLNKEDLKEVVTSNLYFVERITREEGVYLIFFTKKAFIDRESLNLRDANDEVKKLLGHYEEVIGIKTKEEQFADVVFINKSKNLVEYRLDVKRGFSADERMRGFDLINKKIASLFKSIEIDKILTNCLNIFPAILGFYNSKEGRICELGFTTDEASIKYERMRIKKNDLRSERYHFAGKNAVGDIAPFKIAVIWEKINLVDEDVEILIPGSYRALDKDPEINEVVISGCLNQNDYGNVVDKMIAFLEIKQ